MCERAFSIVKVIFSIVVGSGFFFWENPNNFPAPNNCAPHQTASYQLVQQSARLGPGMLSAVSGTFPGVYKVRN